MTNGDQWKNNDNWCSDLPLSKWHGVTTKKIKNNNNNMVVEVVTEINLNTNNLEGNITTWGSDYLGHCQHLETLRLHKNKLQGNIERLERNLAKLTNLQVLRLHHNGFTGDITSLLSESLIHCQQLRYLYLSDNGLNGNLAEWKLEDMMK